MRVDNSPSERRGERKVLAPSPGGGLADHQQQLSLFLLLDHPCREQALLYTAFLKACMAVPVGKLVTIGISQLSFILHFIYTSAPAIENPIQSCFSSNVECFFSPLVPLVWRDRTRLST